MNSLAETRAPLPKSKSHAKSIGLVAALLVHVVVVRLVLMSSSADLEVAGMDGLAQGVANGTAPVFNVALKPSSSGSPHSAPKPPSPFERFEKLTTVPADAIPVSKLATVKPAQSLTKTLGEDVFKATPKIAGAKSEAKDTHVTISSKSAQSLNDLWKAIEPCWRRNATKDTIGVTLVVSFSPLGNLSKPPTIDRPSGVNLDNQRLRSEAQAINALSQCGPYLMAFGQQNVTISFPLDQ